MQEMLLRANVRDYGRFDPPPGHVQPPSKGIPAAAPDPNHPPPPPGNGGCKWKRIHKGNSWLDPKPPPNKSRSN